MICGRSHGCESEFNDLNRCRRDGDDNNRPVIIHRAILGSVERMIAILTENYAGKWWEKSIYIPLLFTKTNKSISVIEIKLRK